LPTREQNERRFPIWKVLSDGGRRYTRVIPGRAGGHARYVKLVDRDEITLRFVQEIYDVEGRLIGVHQKYPTDTGHRLVLGGDDDPPGY